MDSLIISTYIAQDGASFGLNEEDAGKVTNSTSVSAGEYAMRVYDNLLSGADCSKMNPSFWIGLYNDMSTLIPNPLEKLIQLPGFTDDIKFDIVCHDINNGEISLLTAALILPESFSMDDLFIYAVLNDHINVVKFMVERHAYVLDVLDHYELKNEAIKLGHTKCVELLA